ncbi:MAG TPA: CPBP family intramembrane glutamic endopeptidase [Anaerolineales bacterium]
MDAHLYTRRILIFLAFVIGASWVTALLINQSSLMKTDSLSAMALANYIIILTPALANIFTRLVTKEGWGHTLLRLNFRRGWRFYLAAWLLPLLAVIAGGSIFYLLYPQSFDPSAGGFLKMVQGTPFAATASPYLGLLTFTLYLLLVGLTINALASFGEEFGWRAYLLPKLVGRFSGAPGESTGPASGLNPAAARKAALLVGVIWSVWHYPLFFLGASAGSPFPNLLGYLVFTTSLSVLLSWVTLRSGSVWPACIGHGVINATSVLPGAMLLGPAIPLVGPDTTGLIGGLGYIILALALLFTRRAFTVGQEPGSEGLRAVVVP